MPKKLIDALSNIAVRGAKPALRDGHHEKNRQSLRDYVLPKIGARAIASLNTQDIMRIPEPLETAGKLETLRRVRQRISAVLVYAVQTGRRTDHPMRDTQGAFEAPTRALLQH